MTTRLRNTVALVLTSLMFVALLANLSALATEELGRETASRCTACHDKPGSRLLTDQGKYFELTRSMDGYDSLMNEFGRCTYCHRSKPGTARLTREGKKFSDLVGDMKALREWLESHHPEIPGQMREDPDKKEAPQKK